MPALRLKQGWLMRDMQRAANRVNEWEGKMRVVTTYEGKNGQLYRTRQEALGADLHYAIHAAIGEKAAMYDNAAFIRDLARKLTSDLAVRAALFNALSDYESGLASCEK